MPDSSNKYIVVTTINSPTRSVEELAARSASWPLIVIGDNKTPKDWALPGVKFISIQDQRQSAWELAGLLPENHYCRKNLGYLEAIGAGATVLAETDDDNRPGSWPPISPSRTIQSDRIARDGWVNVYEYFTEERVWPRGFPLDEIRGSKKSDSGESPGNWPSSVQQYLAAGDPDVDAIYRLANGKIDHTFTDRVITLAPGAMVPFNSQSTIWFSEAFELLYLPSFVSFRMTDIWRSFIAQVCLWAAGLELSYHGNGVFQERNEHDLMRDFNDEVVGYLRNTEIVRALRALRLSPGKDAIADNLRACYLELRRIEVVGDAELTLVEAWIADLALARAAR